MQKKAFDRLKELDQGVVILMTACFAANEADIESFREHADIAATRNIPCILINIHCNETTNEHRLCSEERRWGRENGGKTKLVDVDVLRALRDENVLLDPLVHLAEGEIKGVIIRQHDLDTSSLSVEETVNQVLESLFC